MVIHLPCRAQDELQSSQALMPGEAPSLWIESINGNYQPKLSVKSSRQDGFVHVSFEDNGPGIPSIFRNQILQPFFTTKKGNQGTGLGLSITNDIIKSHRGTLDIYSEEGAFSRFVIQIPQEQNQVIL